MLMTLFSDRRFMPGKRSWDVPLMSWGRPASSGLKRSAGPVVDRQHVVLDRFDQPETLQLVELLRQLGRQVVGLAPVLAPVVELPHVVVESQPAWPPTISHGVRCLVTALQPLW